MHSSMATAKVEEGLLAHESFWAYASPRYKPIEYMPRAFKFSGHIYGSTFYMATGYHGAHVIIGTIFLAVMLIARV